MSVPLREEFFFQLQGQPTRRQQGHRIDVGVGVRYRPGMTAAAGPMRYPDYRLLQAGIEELLQPTPAVPIDSWWEVVVKAMAQAVLERGHGTLAGVTVQLRVHPWCLPSRASTAEPALWRAAQASLGDGPPLPYPSLEPPCQPLPPQLRPGG
jgi:hypothetical protein